MPKASSQRWFCQHCCCSQDTVAHDFYSSYASSLLLLLLLLHLVCICTFIINCSHKTLTHTHTSATLTLSNSSTLYVLLLISLICVLLSLFLTPSLSLSLCPMMANWIIWLAKLGLVSSDNGAKVVFFSDWAPTRHTHDSGVHTYIFNPHFTRVFATHTNTHTPHKQHILT